MKLWKFVLALLFLSSICFADEHVAASLSPADIQAAIDAASSGDLVILPAGDQNNFNTKILVPVGISIRGQGIDVTILRKTDTDADPIFSINEDRESSTTLIVFSQFTLYGKDDESTEDIGLRFWTPSNDFNKNFRIHHIKFHGFGYAGILLNGYIQGVVDNCTFIDCYKPGLGYGVVVLHNLLGEEVAGAFSYNQALQLGSSYSVFVEDCNFHHNRHAVAGNYGSRFVARYNTVTTHNVPNIPFNTHGGCFVDAVGSRTFEIYNNNVTNSYLEVWGYTGIYGGDGVIFNNTVVDSFESPYSRVHLNHPCCDAANCSSYPVCGQTTDMWVWGNTVNGGSDNVVWVAPQCVTYGIFQKDRDYYEGTAKSGYAPYAYPHPLRGGFITVNPGTVVRIGPGTTIRIK